MPEKCTKTVYHSERAALEAVGRIQAKSQHRKVPVDAYQCAVCQKWHLTSTRNYRKALADAASREEALNVRIAELLQRIEKLVDANRALEASVRRLEKGSEL